ncbi:MAG: DUF2227 family putative metal-binding protein [Chlamydiia bacterium]|nr:DUF2227 family putative metal-binding protein [Chlamydiia bacterium]
MHHMCMSNYKAHAKFNLFVALPLLVGGLAYFFHPKPEELITFAATFAYATLFMNPDVDLASQIRLFSIRGLLTLPFRSYAAFFRHRGLSHNLILGSFTRIIWLFGWGALIFFILYKTLPNTGTLMKFYKRHEFYLIYALAAICLADWGHLLLDRKKR